MKKKYKYLFLSSVVIGNLVTSPVFALTGETSTNETTVSETTPTMENLMEETTKIPTSEEITSSSTDTSSTETSQTENNKETRDVTTGGNWNYHISGEYAYLDSYAGSSTDVVVPNEINGKQTTISLENGIILSEINKDQVTSITFSNNNGKKCKTSSPYISFMDYSSLQTFDGRGLDTSSIIGMFELFTNCGNLISADVSNWDVSNVKTMYSAFSGCSKLQTLDVSNWNTSSVNSFSHMFYQCFSLPAIDVSRWNVSSATSLYYMFNRCSNLQTLDVSNWDTSNVNKMTRVFNECNNLTSLDVSNWDTSNVTDMSYMFYCFSSKIPLLVKATDQKLLNYNYASDNRVPIGPSFNANGGHFSDNSDTKYYFEKCALEPTDPKFQLSTFNNYKNTVEKPIKDGSLFHKWQLTSGTEPTKNDDLLNSNIVYSAQWILSLINDHIPSQDVDNVKPNQSSIFGIAYMPKEFDFGPVTLQDAGKQSISSEGGDYHVAVRDQRMMASGWSLQAQLEWTGKAIPGAEILTSHQGNEVLKNTNDGSQDFNAGSDFESCSLSEVRAEQRVVIKSDAPRVLMTAATKEHNAVYDYDLGRVTLRIPEVKYIQPGSYSGYVNWSLVNAPST